MTIQGQTSVLNAEHIPRRQLRHEIALWKENVIDLATAVDDKRAELDAAVIEQARAVEHLKHLIDLYKQDSAGGSE